MRIRGVGVLACLVLLGAACGPRDTGGSTSGGPSGGDSSSSAPASSAGASSSASAGSSHASSLAAASSHGTGPSSSSSAAVSGSSSAARVSSAAAADSSSASADSSSAAQASSSAANASSAPADSSSAAPPSSSSTPPSSSLAGSSSAAASLPAACAGAGPANVGLGAPLSVAGQTALLNAHNTVRCNAQPVPAVMPALTWDPMLAAVAQAYANRCVFLHNANRTADYAAAGGSGYVGENLFGSSTSPLAGDVVGTWSVEGANYVLATNSCTTGTCGHYTQLVWADTLRIGCASASCPSVNPSRIVICDYSPAGNVIGQAPYVAQP